VYGSISPSHGVPGATEDATGEPSPRRTRTIGRAGERSRSSSAGIGAARANGSAAITASGFSSRPLRSRSRATAVSLVASQAR
jgi:hypothetical protein